MLINSDDWQKHFEGYYKGDVLFGAQMSEQTRLAIGGPADVVVSPEDPVSMKNIVLILGRLGLPYIPLGNGTNVLVRDGGIEGVVVKFGNFRRIEKIKEEGDNIELFAEAGMQLQKLVNYCRENGYSGIEGLTGIPGTLGGAICGNAGSYNCEIRDILVSVVLLRSDGRLDRARTEDLGFGYRRSGIKSGDIVLSANLRLRRDEPEAVAGRTDEFFGQKRTSQPVGERSAGCVFRNPEGMSAGKMIDETGCKGMRRGDIEVSSTHANFFVNRGGGTAADYLSLMDAVALKVKERFNVSLEPEIRIIGKA